MQKLISKFTETFGPSGLEDDIRRVIYEEVKNYADEVFIDPLGNLVAVRKGKDPRLMLAAHMDEIGLIITHIDEKGFLRISSVGGVTFYQLIGQRFMFANGTIGTVYHEKVDSFKELTWSKLYLDIGAANKEEAAAKVSLGDMAVFHHSFVDLGKRYIAKAMDDRIGCVILVELLKRLYGQKVSQELVFVFTVQEEVGLRGAKSAAYKLAPRYAVAVDVTRVGDMPEAPRMDVSLGKGPAIKVKDSSVICHPKVRDLMVKTAEKNKIDYQLEVLERGGTDAGSIHLSREGVPSGVMSIPCRYVHTASEMVDGRDVENGVTLMEKICLSPEWSSMGQ